MQFNYASRHSAIQVKAAHREAVKPAPAPAKEDKPKGVELKWQPGQLKLTCSKHLCKASGVYSRLFIASQGPQSHLGHLLTQLERV